MPTPEPNDEISLHRPTSVRTCGIRGNPDHVVLEIEAGGKAWHFVLHVLDLAALGRRMTQDAMMLAPPNDPTGQMVREQRQ